MACCPGHDFNAANLVHSPPVAAEATWTPARPSGFVETNIKKDLPDGYYIEAFPFRTKPLDSEGPVGPEIIGYGLGFIENDVITPSDIKMCLNPFNEMKNQITPPNEWPMVVIQKLNFPVAVSYGNFRPKSGLNDVVICHDYGKSMDALDPDGGTVSYLKNPGDKTSTTLWEKRKIGASISTHRIKTGYFTQKDHVEVIGFPIMSASSDRESPAPIIVWKPTEWDADGTPVENWEPIMVNNDTFRLIHDAQVIHSTTGGLDRVIVAGREGVSLVWMDEKSQQWQHANIGTGLPQMRRPLRNPYWGAGSVATARVGSDNVGYIASCEAFHGNVVSVYVKPTGTRPDQIVSSEHWRRFVIDDFGPLSDEGFTGTLHHVACADLDGSGVDSIVVSCMGHPENKPENMGAYVYRPIDLARGLFSRTKISNASAARSAIADYRCSGTMDVATISYSVPNYLVTPNPALRVMLNNTKQIRHAIKVQRLGDEVMIRVPRSKTADHVSELPFLDIGGKLLSIVVLPPHKEYLLGEGFEFQGHEYEKDGVKVINGTLSWLTPNGTKIERGIAVETRDTANMIPDTNDNIVKAGEHGAIFVRLRSSIPTSMPGLKFDNMDDVATINGLPFNADPETRNMLFPWVACRDRDWGQGGFDWPFYNLVGYHVLYDDDTLTNLCHIQAWTLGVGQTAAFHNHDKKGFCEIHACISNGTNRGGMYWAKDAAGDAHLGANPNELDPEKLERYADMIVVDDMQEHGPLWRTNEDGLPLFRPNGTVDYPYHAWLAGPKQDEEAFDVWLAFEFPATEFMPDVPKALGCASC